MDSKDSFLKKYASHPNYFAPKGRELHALSWSTEAPLRMLLNNLDVNVAENPNELIVYGGTGQAARSPKDLQKIISALLRLKEDQSLLIQSGKAVGILPTHPFAPRVLIANSNLVPKWSDWDHFEELKKRGLMMYGQMTAGSWIYIGTQGILQGTYETFAEAARQHFGGSLAGKWVLSGGLGGMGGAQPLAATLNGAVFLGADVDELKLQKRLNTGYLDIITRNCDEAISMVKDALQNKKALSIGLVGNIVDLIEKLIEENFLPDLATDQTSAHDPLFGYVPAGISLENAFQLRKSDPIEYKKRSIETMGRHVAGLLHLQNRGKIVFDYGNNLRVFGLQAGVKNAFEIKGFVPLYIRPLFCKGLGPFRWVALSGEKEDIYRTDEALIELFPENTQLKRWLLAAREKIAFQGLPARICWLGLGERAKAGLAFNEMVKKGILKAPIVIGRDHLDSGSVASPNRETEAMKDGSDAVSDWPLLNLMANTSSGATWVSFHHGGGVGMGYSQHAGMVVLADGTDASKEKLSRVLFNDPATGVIRHADAGYDEAIETSRKFSLELPQ